MRLVGDKRLNPALLAFDAGDEGEALKPESRSRSVHSEAWHPKPDIERSGLQTGPHDATTSRTAVYGPVRTVV